MLDAPSLQYLTFIENILEKVTQGRLVKNVDLKKKTTPQEDQNMLACVQQRPQTSSSRIVKEQNLNIQARTVRRRLTGFGLHSYWATRKEALTANGTNDRVSFCLEYLPVDEDNWT